MKIYPLCPRKELEMVKKLSSGRYPPRAAIQLSTAFMLQRRTARVVLVDVRQSGALSVLEIH